MVLVVAVAVQERLGRMESRVVAERLVRVELGFLAQLLVLLLHTLVEVVVARLLVG
jgi:hypothetical protein